MNSTYLIKLLAATSVVALLASTHTAKAGTLYDAVGGFDPQNNPSCGNWSYGSSASLAGPFMLYGDSTRANALDFWGTDLSVTGLPLVMRNDLPCVQANVYGTAVLPGHQVALVPGATGEFSIVRWIAPSSTTYAIVAAFTVVDSGPASTSDVHVLVNNTSRFSRTVYGYGSNQSTKIVIGLASNSVVDFVVGNGRDGAANDTVALNASIEVADVTVPAVTATGNPLRLWPPNRKTVNVTITGTITDNSGPIDSCDTSYEVIDEYGQISFTGLVVVGPGGDYSFTVPLIASRLGTDRDGRKYSILVTAMDASGNAATAVVEVIVPHDQRKK